jgi:hypothetical membrane protein
MHTKQVLRRRGRGAVGAAGGLIHLRGAALAWAGIAGPVLFTATFLAQEGMRRDEYSPMAEPVSALEAGPHGWVQQVNFVIFGVLTMAYAVGLHQGLRPTRRGIVGPALIFVSGVGLVLAAVFPLRQNAAGVTYDPGGHLVAGMTFFLSSAIGLIVLSRRVASDPAWRRLARPTLAAGAVAVLGFVGTGIFVMPDDAPLHEWAGLTQRLIVIGVLFPCRIILAVRLLSVMTR